MTYGLLKTEEVMEMPLPLATLAARVAFLALGVLAPEVPPELVQAHKGLVARGAPRRDLLVVACSHRS